MMWSCTIPLPTESWFAKRSKSLGISLSSPALRSLRKVLHGANTLSGWRSTHHFQHTERSIKSCAVSHPLGPINNWLPLLPGIMPPLLHPTSLYSSVPASWTQNLNYLIIRHSRHHDLTMSAVAWSWKLVVAWYSSRRIILAAYWKKAYKRFCVTWLQLRDDLCSIWDGVRAKKMTGCSFYRYWREEINNVCWCSTTTNMLYLGAEVSVILVESNILSTLVLHEDNDWAAERVNEWLLWSACM
jgi:hypothetical protein